jgi:hypothetical protein
MYEYHKREARSDLCILESLQSVITFNTMLPHFYWLPWYIYYRILLTVLGSFIMSLKSLLFILTWLRWRLCYFIGCIQSRTFGISKYFGTSCFTNNNSYISYFSHIYNIIYIIYFKFVEKSINNKYYDFVSFYFAYLCFTDWIKEKLTAV